MVFSRRPMCEDSVDRFNHTWLVYFLLFMAALTFILPFGLSQSGEVKRLVDLPRYNAICWCPAQFTDNMVEYATTLCRDAFLNVHSKDHEESKYNTSEAILFKSRHEERYVPENDINSNTTEDFDEHQLKGTANFLFDNTPVFLFLSAVCIKLVHLSFVLFMSWYGVNVSGLIQRWQLLYQNTDRNKQERQNFIITVSERLGSSQRLTSGYFIYKAVICFICTLFTLIVNVYFIPSIEMAQSQLYLISHPLSANLSYSNFKSEQLVCSFSIRILQNVHKYAINCFFTPPPDSDMQPDHSDEAVTNRTFSLYGSIFSGLFFTFFIISTINVVNMILWMVKLCRNRCFSSSKQTLSLDASLLVRLMEDHLDLGASKAMENSLAPKNPETNADLTSEATDVV